MKKLMIYILYVFTLIWSTSCDQSQYSTEKKDNTQTEAAAESANESGYGTATPALDSTAVEEQ